MGSKVRKSLCSVQESIRILCSTIFPALKSFKIKSTRDVDWSPGEMSVVVTLYVSNNKKININDIQSKLHSVGPKLKSNLVTGFDETNG